MPIKQHLLTNAQGLMAAKHEMRKLIGHKKLGKFAGIWMKLFQALKRNAPSFNVCGKNVFENFNGFLCFWAT